MERYVVNDPRDLQCPIRGFNRNAASITEHDESSDYVFHATSTVFADRIETRGWEYDYKPYEYDVISQLCRYCDDLALGDNERVSARVSLYYTLKRLEEGAAGGASFTADYANAHDYASKVCGGVNLHESNVQTNSPLIGERLAL